MILYYILSYFALRSLQLLAKGRLVNTLGVNLSDPSYDSGLESAPYILTTNSTKDNVELGSDGGGSVGAELSTSIRGLSGVTMVDQWRLTSSFTGIANPVASNLERVDTNSFSQIGSGMSRLGSVFTFPESGIYQIIFNSLHRIDGDDDNIISRIEITTDNNTYDYSSYAQGSINSATSQAAETLFSTCVFDVSDISTHKCRFVVVTGNSSTNTIGTTSANFTYMTFIRLGDR